jgi:hypothetical protein
MRFESPHSIFALPALLETPPSPSRVPFFHGFNPHHPSLLLLDCPNSIISFSCCCPVALCMLRGAAQDMLCCGHHTVHTLLVSYLQPGDSTADTHRNQSRASRRRPGVRQMPHRHADAPTDCRSSMVPTVRGTSTLQWTLLLLGGFRRWLGRVRGVMKSQSTASITFPCSRLPRRRCFTSKRRGGGRASEMGSNGVWFNEGHHPPPPAHVLFLVKKKGRGFSSK